MGLNSQQELQSFHTVLHVFRSASKIPDASWVSLNYHVKQYIHARTHTYDYKLAENMATEREYQLNTCFPLFIVVKQCHGRKDLVHIAPHGTNVVEYWSTRHRGYRCGLIGERRNFITEEKPHWL